MHPSQAEKAERFRALHAGPGTFVIPNPWDAGTARILSTLGFEALTTTSAGLAFVLGRPDGAGLVTRDEALANARIGRHGLPVAPTSRTGMATRPRPPRTPSVSPAGGRAGRGIDRGRDR